MTQANASPVLSVKNLKVYFDTAKGIGSAVDGVNFDLNRAEILGLVGESGCGKSLTALSILGLHPEPAARIVAGQVLLDGVDLSQLAPKQLRRYRGKGITLVLQDPMTSLNSVFRIRTQLGRVLRRHHQLKGKTLIDRAIEILRLLRVPGPAHRLRAYPHEFSGGMRQRVVSGIALGCNPKVLIADEPTTSLDVTVELAYLALLREIQQGTGLSILFITHDFGVVAKICDRVAVMYAGRVIETAPTLELLEEPAHPYTEALLKSVPDIRENVSHLPAVEGSPPSIYEKPAGCPFAPRCAYVMERCRVDYPPEAEIADAHTVNCWRHV